MGLLFEKQIERATKFADIERANLKQSSVQKKSRRALNTQSSRICLVRIDHRFSLLGIQTRVELGSVHAHANRITLELFLGVRAYIFARPHLE